MRDTNVESASLEKVIPFVWQRNLPDIAEYLHSSLYSDLGIFLVNNSNTRHYTISVHSPNLILYKLM
jgi:hypothetical protein